MSAADWGTAMHLAKADPTTASDPWLTMMDPHRDLLWPARLGVHEQAVAYDCRARTVEIGPANLPTEQMDAWKNSRGPDTITGTCDWWASLPTGEPWVDDLKTGWKTPDVLTPQMLFYSLCRALSQPAWDARTVRVSITHYPRAAAEPTREGLWRQVGPVQLDAFQDDLHHAWVRATGFNTGAKPGPWCRYCPSAQVCDRANE